MKQLLIILVWVVLQPALFCKKKDDPPPPKNWRAELPGTTWVGDYQYKSGTYTDLQPFSIVFALSDFVWSDVSGDFPGTYTVVENNKVILTFNTGSIMSADIEKNSWTNFKEITPLNWKINNLSLSTRVEPTQLINTIWEGKESTYPMKLQFISSTMLKVSYNNGLFENKEYKVKGGAIEFKPIGGSLENYFGVFIDNGKTFNGIKHFKLSYSLWSLSK